MARGKARVRLVGRLVKSGIIDERKTRAITNTLSQLKENGVKLAELEKAIKLLPPDKFSVDFFAENVPSASKGVYATGDLWKKFEKQEKAQKLLEELSEQLNYVSPKALSETIGLFPYVGREERKEIEFDLKRFLEYHSLRAARETAGALYAQVLHRANISPELTRGLLSFSVHPEAHPSFRQFSSEAAKVRITIENFERKDAPDSLPLITQHVINKLADHPDYSTEAKRELIRSPSTLVVLARLNRSHVANPPEEYEDTSFWWKTLVRQHFTSKKTSQLLAAVENALPHLQNLREDSRGLTEEQRRRVERRPFENPEANLHERAKAMMADLKDMDIDISRPDSDFLFALEGKMAESDLHPQPTDFKKLVEIHKKHVRQVNED